MRSKKPCLAMFIFAFFVALGCGRPDDLLLNPMEPVPLEVLVDFLIHEEAPLQYHAEEFSVSVNDESLTCEGTTEVVNASPLNLNVEVLCTNDELALEVATQFMVAEGADGFEITEFQLTQTGGFILNEFDDCETGVSLLEEAPLQLDVEAQCLR